MAEEAQAQTEQKAEKTLARDTDAEMRQLDAIFDAANDMSVEGCDKALSHLGELKRVEHQTTRAIKHDEDILEETKKELKQKGRAKGTPKKEKVVRRILSKKKFSPEELMKAVNAALHIPLGEDEINSFLEKKKIVYKSAQGKKMYMTIGKYRWVNHPEIYLEELPDHKWVTVHPSTLPAALSEAAIEEEKHGVSGKEIPVEDLLLFISENREKMPDDKIRKDLHGTKLTRMHNSATIDDYADGMLHFKHWHKDVWVPIGEHALRAAVVLDKDMKNIEKRLHKAGAFGMDTLGKLVGGIKEDGQPMTDEEFRTEFAEFLDKKDRDKLMRQLTLCRKFFKHRK